MYRHQYYEQIKTLALSIRQKYEISKCRVMPIKIKEICKQEGILTIKKWPNLGNLRGMYINDKLGSAIMISDKLPRDPYAFTLAHELKHHLMDREIIGTFCKKGKISEAIEIGAEIFAAELLFPEEIFLNMLNDFRGSRDLLPSDIVRLKKETDTTLSYEGIKKRVLYHGLSDHNKLKGIQWKKLEEEIYGEPPYKRINRQRKERNL